MSGNVFRKILFAGIFSFAIFFLFSQSVHAATISFSPSSGTYSVGDTVPVQIIVSSSDQSVNAVSVRSFFPQINLK